MTGAHNDGQWTFDIEEPSQPIKPAMPEIVASKPSPNPAHPKPIEKRKTSPSKECASCKQACLSVDQVAKRFGVSRAAIWRWSADSIGFPASIKLTRGTTRWKLSELIAFEMKQAKSGSALLSHR